MTMQRFSGKQYLQIDIANQFGLDKLDWSERLTWFIQNESKLVDLVHEADEPALMYAGLLAYEAMKQHKPSSYPVSLDATASGMQILACLIGDREAAMQCNVIDSGKREDAYSNVYGAMLSITGDSAKIDRSHAKDAVMTSLYGSEAQPKKVFGEGALLQIFYQTMEKLTPYVWSLNQAFLEMWQPDVFKYSWIMPDNGHVHIKVMDKVMDTIHFLDEPFDAIKSINQPIEKGRSLCANVTHSCDGMVVREMVRRCDYDPKRVEQVARAINSANLDTPECRFPQNLNNDHAHIVKTLWALYKESGFLSARILQHLRADNLSLVDSFEPIKELIESLPPKPFKVMTIHDCFRCLPNYGNDLRKQYNIILAMIAKSDLLSYIVSQILNRPVTIGKANPDMWKDVLEANYSLS